MFPGAGAIVGLLGQGVAGALSIINNRKMQQNADAESAREQSFYAAKANENPLSRSENQHILGQYDRQSQQQLDTARNMATITGATPEFSTSVQKGIAEGRANLMGQMSAGASQRADRYETLGEMARHRKAQEDMQRREARNSTYAALAGNAASAVGSIMDAYNTPEIKAGGNNELTTAENIAKAPTRVEQLQLGADAATSPVEKQVLQDTADAAKNAQKLATATPPAPYQPRVGREFELFDPESYIDNGDGTFTKGGVRYYKNFDGSYTMVD